MVTTGKQETGGDNGRNEAGLELPRTGGFQAFIFTVLTFAAIFLSYADRSVFSIVTQAIKVDLKLTDTALGLLGGLTFVLLYAGFSLPVARLADHVMKRRDVATVSIVLWSIATAACGVATGFFSLFLARMMVGIGESGVQPAAYSMAGSIFKPEQRGKVIGAFGFAAATGSLTGLTVGGWLLQDHGWRGTFIILGLVGLPLALVYFALVREPARATGEGSKKGTFLSDLWRVLRVPSFLFVVLGTGIYSIALHGMAGWLPSLLMRQYAKTPAEVGVLIGVSKGAATLIGILIGGVMADRKGGRDHRWMAWAAAGACFLATPVGVAGFLSHSALTTVICAGVVVLLLLIPQVPGLVLSQVLVPPHLRATGAALIFMSAAIIGQGGGLLFVGFMSDHPSAVLSGSGPLASALCLAMAFPALGGVCFLVASLWLQHETPPDRASSAMR